MNVHRSILVAVLTAPLVLTACGGIQAATPTATVTVTSEAPRPAPAPEPEPEPEPEPAANSDDETYLAFLASKGINADPDTSIEVGRNVCDVLDQGISITRVMDAAIDAGFTTDQAAAIVAAAIVTYCPWNESLVDS